MNFDIENLNDVHLDVLKEIGNVGAGNAATSLSALIGRPILMDVPKTNIIAFNEVEKILGGVEEEVTGIYLKFYGEISGTMMLVLDKLSTLHLLSFLMGKDRQNPRQFEPGTVEVSALKEVGNILTGSFLTALSEMTGLSIKHTIPAICTDMAGAILSVPLIEFGLQGDRALFIDTNFSEGAMQVAGHLFLIPDIDSYAILLKSLGLYRHGCS